MVFIDKMEITNAEIIDNIRLKGDYETSLKEVVERKLTREAAKKKGIEISVEDLQRASDTFRIVNGLNTSKATEEWLKSNGISLDKFEELLETNLLISRFKESLEKEVDREKYLSSPQVRELVTEMIYQDWLNQHME